MQKKNTFEGKFHGNVTSHFSALIVTDFIPLSYFDWIAGFNSLLYWVVLGNPKTILCRPLGFNYLKILFFLMLFKMSPLKIAQKYPFWAHSGDLLKMLVLKKPGHVIHHRKENFIRISEMIKTSFWNKICKNDKLFTDFWRGVDELFAYSFLQVRTANNMQNFGLFSSFVTTRY